MQATWASTGYIISNANETLALPRPNIDLTNLSRHSVQLVSRPLLAYGRGTGHSAQGRGGGGGMHGRFAGGTYKGRKGRDALQKADKGGGERGSK